MIYPQPVLLYFDQQIWVLPADSLAQASSEHQDATGRQHVCWFIVDHRYYYRIRGSVWATACCALWAELINQAPDKHVIPPPEHIIATLMMPPLHQHHAHWVAQSLPQANEQPTSHGG